MGALIALLLVCWAAPQEVADPVENGRLLIGRGQLSEAERLLVPVAEGTQDDSSAWAWLLLGNIAYERGEYPDALRLYSEAMQRAGSDAKLAEVASGNRILALERTRRQDRLAGRLRWLLGALAAVVVGGGLAVALMARQRPATSSSTSARAR